MPNPPVISIDNGTLQFGDRVLWDDLNISLEAGEFLAILGPNGSGKSSLLRAILGLEPLTKGSISYAAELGTTPIDKIGYIPQHRAFDRALPVRGVDLVGLGMDGNRFGLGRRAATQNESLNNVLESVGATSYAQKAIGVLSGGEQQRLRVAQALVSGPSVLLCDEPLVSLDLHHQQVIAELIHNQAKTRGAAVAFVTHEINPIISYVDRVLYLVDGKWAVGTVDEVLNSETLSALYASPVDVIKVRDRLVIVGAADASHHDHFDAHMDASGQVH